MKPVREFAEQVLVLMTPFTRAVMRAERNALSRGVISLPLFSVLQFAVGERGCAMHRVAAALGLKKPTVTVHVDRLVRLGMVKRRSDPQDRRAVVVEATPRGRAVIRQVHAERRDTIGRLFGVVSQQDRRAFLRVMQRVVDGLQQTAEKRA